MGVRTPSRAGRTERAPGGGLRQWPRANGSREGATATGGCHGAVAHLAHGDRAPVQRLLQPGDGHRLFGRVAGNYMDGYAVLQRALNQGMERYLNTFNLPTHSDIVELGERLHNIEERLATIETNINNLFAERGVSPTAAVTQLRPGAHAPAPQPEQRLQVAGPLARPELRRGIVATTERPDVRRVIESAQDGDRPQPPAHPARRRHPARARGAAGRRHAEGRHLLARHAAPLPLPADDRRGLPGAGRLHHVAGEQAVDPGPDAGPELHPVHADAGVRRLHDRLGDPAAGGQAARSSRTT